MRSSSIFSKSYRFIELANTIQPVLKMRCHGNYIENNALLLKRQKPIVYTNVSTILQLETTQFVRLIFYKVK